IKGILNDYDPSSIFNEFLQNASDAGATECHFYLDTRSYDTEKVFSEQMAAWQGPALIIYNNAEFSEKDFEALCKLGIGNKKDDPSKIGRHGLGFNSVYHFTDVPSIVSGPYLGFFDPQ
ncbi:histidine kinase-like ATPase, partial [Linnemannia elongata]